MKKKVIKTDLAPEAIGTYSQAFRAGETVYFSGQLGIDPKTMKLVEGGVEAQIRQAFRNIKNVAEAAGGALSDVVKLQIFLCDLQYASFVNDIMGEMFNAPYPARAVVQVAALPLNAGVEIDGVMVADDWLSEFESSAY